MSSKEREKRMHLRLLVFKDVNQVYQHSQILKRSSRNIKRFPYAVILQ